MMAVRQTKWGLLVLCALCFVSQPWFYESTAHADSIGSAIASGGEETGGEQTGEAIGVLEMGSLQIDELGELPPDESAGSKGDMMESPPGESEGSVADAAGPPPGESEGSVADAAGPPPGESEGSVADVAGPPLGESASSEVGETGMAPNENATIETDRTEVLPGESMGSGTETAPGESVASGTDEAEQSLGEYENGGGGQAGELVPGAVASSSAKEASTLATTAPSNVEKGLRPNDVFSIEVADNIDFALDQYGLKKGKQVYSKTYFFRNTGEQTILLSLMDIRCDIAGDVVVADESDSDETVRENEDKVVKLFILFENGDKVYFTEAGNEYQVVLGVGESLPFCIEGCMSGNEDNEWQDGEISVHMIYRAEGHEETG